MTLTASTAARNACVDAVVALIDGGSGAGKLKIYDASDNLLVTIPLADPSFPAASNGEATANAIAEATASGSGEMAKYTVTDSADTVVLSEGPVVEGTGSDPTTLYVDEATTVAGVTKVVIDSLVVTQPATA